MSATSISGNPETDYTDSDYRTMGETLQACGLSGLSPIGIPSRFSLDSVEVTALDQTKGTADY
jgi:hypothetical protein